MSRSGGARPTAARTTTASRSPATSRRRATSASASATRASTGSSTCSRRSRRATSRATRRRSKARFGVSRGPGPGGGGGTIGWSSSGHQCGARLAVHIPGPATAARTRRGAAEGRSLGAAALGRARWLRRGLRRGGPGRGRRRGWGATPREPAIKSLRDTLAAPLPDASRGRGNLSAQPQTPGAPTLPFNDRTSISPWDVESVSSL